MMRNQAKNWLVSEWPDSSMVKHRISIIGCGNANRCDDAVGPAVIAGLKARFDENLPDDLLLLDAGTAGVEVMFRARGCEELVIVDASQSGSEPGSLFQVPGDELAEIHEANFSLHDFRWQHALYAGQKMYGEEFPDKVTVYLVEAERLDFGLSLSPPVQKRAETLIESLYSRYSCQERAA